MGTWYLANGFGIALGGLLGFGIGNIKGSLPSWKFEFLIIGALCFVWGIVMYIFLPDSPVTAKGLTLREKRVVVERLRGNQTGIENKHLKAYQVKEAFCDVKLYLFFLLGMVCNIPNGGEFPCPFPRCISHLTLTLLHSLPNQKTLPSTAEKLTSASTGISNFGTIIIKGFGFSTLVTTLMQIPYGAIIAISILICVFANEYVEKTGRQARSWFILLFLAPNIAGAFGLAYLDADNQAGRLVSYYLTGPYNAAFVMVLSMSTANTAGHTKKVVTNGMFMFILSFHHPQHRDHPLTLLLPFPACLFLGYCTGNIAGPFFYLSSQAPRYELGIWSMIVSHLIEVCLILTLRFVLSRENKRRDEIQSAMQGGLEGRDLDATAFGDLTDKENLNFRYIY
jgi:MFS family permease